ASGRRAAVNGRPVRGSAQGIFRQPPPVHYASCMDDAEDFHNITRRIHAIEDRVRIADDRQPTNVLGIGRCANAPQAPKTLRRPAQLVLDLLCGNGIVLSNLPKDAFEVRAGRRRKSYLQARLRRQKASISASETNSPWFA